MRRLAIGLLALAIAAAGCTQTPAKQSGSASETPTMNPPSPPSSASTAQPSPTTGAPTSPAAPAAGTLSVYYVNVGQGDGTVWRLPDGSIIVYDCGPATSSAASNPIVRLLEDTLAVPKGGHIWALIASHGHLDHIGGCQEVLAEFTVERVIDEWYQGSDQPTSYSSFRNDVRAEHATLYDAQDDAAIADDQVLAEWQDLPLPSTATGVQLQLLWPGSPATNWGQIADHSLVVRLGFGSVHYCFQGDIESKQEATLTASGHSVGCDVYLMGHHGSRYASSAAWLSAMHPKIAPVSFGTNSYGHPTAEALCRVQQAGAKVYATQRLGTIQISTDGRAVTVSPDQLETKDYCAAGADYWSSASASPPPPSPASSGSLNVTASVSNTAPCQNAHVTVTVLAADEDGHPAMQANVTSDWKYKSSTSHTSATTDMDGRATLDRGIGAATAGYTVTVTVSVALGTAKGTASVAFTPQSC